MAAGIDWTLRATDVAIVVATLLGPVLAVQAQKWIERGRAADERKRAIFRVLMANRATTTAPACVEALNAIPVEFYRKNNAKLKSITDSWYSYLDELNVRDASGEIIGPRRADKLLTLLHNISTYLGYNFSLSDIRKDFYRPAAHVNIETDEAAIRQGLAKLLSGESAIPMAVKEFPADPNALLEQEALRDLLKDWLEGKRAVKVSGP